MKSENRSSKKTIINPDFDMVSKLEYSELPFTISELIVKLHKLEKYNQI